MVGKNSSVDKSVDTCVKEYSDKKIFIELL